MDGTGLAGLGIAAGALVVATGLGWWYGRRGARLRPAPAPAARGQLLTALGVVPGPAATLLQFSSAFCAPCRATRARCRHLAAADPGVRYLEVDAERHLDAVRALGVWRTPTVFVVDGGGWIVARLTGAPTRDQLAGVVTPLLAGRAVRT